MRNILFAINIVVNYLLGIGGLVIHIWTVIILYSMHGLLGAAIGLCLPVASEIYLVFASKALSGIFLTKYNVFLFTYVIALVVLKITMIMLLPKGDKE